MQETAFFIGISPGGPMAIAKIRTVRVGVFND
jgi:hypothetical protein